MCIEIEEIFNISKEFIMDKEWLYRYILKNSYKIFKTNNSKKYWENIYNVSKLYNTLNPDTLEYALYKMIDLNDEKLINISIMHLLINKINKNKKHEVRHSGPLCGWSPEEAPWEAVESSVSGSEGPKD